MSQCECNDAEKRGKIKNEIFKQIVSRLKIAVPYEEIEKILVAMSMTEEVKYKVFLDQMTSGLK